jgi:hypothetical protein
MVKDEPDLACPLVLADGIWSGDCTGNMSAHATVSRVKERQDEIRLSLGESASEVYWLKPVQAVGVPLDDQKASTVALETLRSAAGSCSADAAASIAGAHVVAATESRLSGPIWSVREVAYALRNGNKLYVRVQQSLYELDRPAEAMVLAYSGGLPAPSRSSECSLLTVGTHEVTGP